jgi:phosphatidylinositol glycan class Z
LKCVWFVFNFILYIFFGWLHQGGLIDTLLRTPVITNESSSNAVYIYYKTYMPPAFLARGDKSKSLLSSPSQCVNDQADASDDTSCSDNALKTNENECKASSSQHILLDLQGNDPPVLLNVLQNYLPCTQTDHEDDHSLRIYLITPFSVVQSLLNVDQRTNTSFEQVSTWEGYIFRKDYSSPHVHVSTEDWPAWDGSILNFLGQLELVVYEVSCILQ